MIDKEFVITVAVEVACEDGGSLDDLSRRLEGPVRGRSDPPQVIREGIYDKDLLLSM